ncbi:MAG: elongation factor Ts [Bacteroidales bacterium]|nr:elongation factor Ts [Bacteroidales bacterium]
MTQIKAAEVSKLRKTTGAGMMDCKKALQESNGDFDKAIEIIRKKGQAIANKRADRDASEGVVLAKADQNNKKGAIIVLNCETDFVAKNEDFVKFAENILNLAIEKAPEDVDALKNLQLNNKTVSENIIEQIGIIGEKLDLPYYEKLDAEKVIAYIHPGNKLATIVGLNKEQADNQIGRDVAMQIAAMNPVSIDKNSIPKEVIDKELEIGKELARKEGKPENILDKIAQGRLNKFFKENTLLEQAFIKNNKMTIKQYLSKSSSDLTVTAFKRYSLKG